MDVHKGNIILRNKEILIDRRDIYYGWDKIRSHQNKFETLEHFLTKAIIGKLIMVKGDGMISEYEYPDGNVVDVLQIKGKELIGYQIESNSFEEKEFKNTDIITISLKKHPEALDLIKRLKEIFEDYIV